MTHNTTGGHASRKRYLFYDYEWQNKARKTTKLTRRRIKVGEIDVKRDNGCNELTLKIRHGGHEKSQMILTNMIEEAIVELLKDVGYSIERREKDV